jgi:SAM-dependent methyltransferase
LAPFEDGSFGAVVCQFGVMFFPDRQAAFAEINRVLRPGGAFLFNTWDRIEANEFAHVVADAAASVFPDDPPRFLARTPYGYFDHAEIRNDLSAAGFADDSEIDLLEAQSLAATPDMPAIAFCQGTPLRSEIESRDGSLLRHVKTNVNGLIRGFVVSASAT